MRGLVAYRPDVCSRRIVSLYTYLWLSTLVIQTLIAPSVWLIRNHSVILKLKSAASRLVQRAKDKMPEGPKLDAAPGSPNDTASEHSTKDKMPEEPKLDASPGSPNDTASEHSHHDTDADVKEVQSKVVAFSSALVLTAAIFSPLAPLLLVWCLLAVSFQLYAASWLFRTKKATIGTALAEACLVQLPAGLLCILYHLGVWCLNGSILFDLEFDTTIKVTYSAFSMLEVLATLFLWRQSHNTLKQTQRGLDSNSLSWLVYSQDHIECGRSEESSLNNDKARIFKSDELDPTQETIESLDLVESGAVDRSCTWWFGDCMSDSHE